MKRHVLSVIGWVCLIATLVLTALQLFLAGVKGAEIVDPNAQSTIMQMDDKSFVWLVSRWEAAGFVFPLDGKTNDWSQYVLTVSDISKLQENDAVVFQSKSDEAPRLGLVAAADKVIVVYEPLVESGLIMIHTIERGEIQVAMRPVKKAQ